MEHFEKNGVNRMLMRVVALCLAIAVCLPLTLTARATLDDLGGQEQGEQNNQEGNVVEPNETPSTPSQGENDTAPGETPATASQVEDETESIEETDQNSIPTREDIDAAMEELLAVTELDDATKDEIKGTLSNKEPTQELLDAIHDYTSSLRKKRAILDTQSLLNSSGYFDDDELKFFWENLAYENELPSAEELKGKILSIIQDPSFYIPEGTDGQAYEEWTEDINALVTEVQKRLDALKTEIDDLKGAIDTSEEGIISSEITQISGELDTISNDIKSYLEFPPDGSSEWNQGKYEEILGKLEEQENRVRTLWVTISCELEKRMKDNAGRLEDLEKTAEDQKPIIEDTASKLIFGYIALGIGVLGVIMGIVATVAALRQTAKPEEEEVELSSRKDVEDLEKKYAYLKNQFDKLEKRTDTAIAASATDAADAVAQEQLNQISAKLEDLIKRLDEIEKKRTGDGPQNPPPPPIPLHLNYQSISPGNSYLTEEKSGIYLLCEMENTVTLKPESMIQMNEFGSWRASGLLYMFQPVVNEKELNPDDMLPDGFYQPAEVLKPARVRKNSNGSYALVERGRVKMIRY